MDHKVKCTQHPKTLQNPDANVLRPSTTSFPADSKAFPIVLKTDTTELPKLAKPLVRAPPTVSAACKNPFSISSPNSVKPVTTMLNPFSKKSPTSFATFTICPTATRVILSTFARTKFTPPSMIYPTEGAYCEALEVSG